MKSFVGFLVLVALLAGAIYIAASPSSASSPERYGLPHESARAFPVRFFLC